ncbi:hypothetical protein ACEWY4_009502 [Coilia grayii]|uniref:Pyrin domain-containing protein n=1 Tax=Coilia grayii TaxID=363190 RepID=A0ABD1K6P5_9TELE
METSEMETEQTGLIPDGRGASVHGTESDGEEEDMYVDRDSLDLSDMCYIPRAASPAPSYLSMESDGKVCDEMIAETHESPARIELERPDSAVSSIYSLESDEDVDSDLKPELELRKRPKNKKVSYSKPELNMDPDYKRHPALTTKFAFKFLQQLLKKLNEAQLKFFKKYLWERYPEFFRDPLDCLDILDVVDKMLECCDIELSLNITKHIFQYMQMRKLVNYMQEHLQRNEVRYGLKEQLRKQYSTMHEGCSTEGSPADFESVYTELYMTQGRYAPANCEHELRGEVKELRLELRSSIRLKPRNIEELYDKKEVEHHYLHLVIMRGIPGIGKSAAVQRFIMDWVNEKIHEEIFFIFPLSGRKLIPQLETEKSFMELIHELFPCTTGLEEIEYDDCKVMYIVDDTDELLHELDFVYSFNYCDSNTRTEVRNILTNLIKGHLQSYSFVLVVTLPLASCQVPSDRVHQVIEIRGFLGDNRENYFRNRYRGEPAMAERMVNYVRANPTILIMCYHPLFCWVVSHVMEKVFRKYPPGQEPPNTLTGLYCFLLRVFLNMREHKRQEQQPYLKDNKWEDERQMVLKLGKLAYNMLEKEEWEMMSCNWKNECNECNPKEALLRSGLCTEYYREMYVLYNEKMRSFIQPTLHEYMAALYVFLTFKNNGKNVLDTSKISMIKLREPSLADLYRSAVDKIVHSKAAVPCHYDLFTRFLVGLGAESNQNILGSLFNHVGCKASAVEDAVRVIRKKIKEHPDKAENLEKCLQELYPSGQKPKK